MHGPTKNMSKIEKKFMESEQKLQESEKRLLYAQSIAHLGFFDWNPITGELYWSDETYRIFGFNPQEFVPTYEKFRSLVHPEDHDFVQKHVEAAMREDIKYNIDFRFVRPTGEVGYVNAQGDVIRDAKGNTIRFVGTQIDITERKKTELKLKESEDKFRTAVKNSPDFIIFINREGTIFEVNRLVKGFTREMVIGQSIFNESFYETKDQCEYVQKAISDSMESGETIQYQHSQIAPDGSFASYENIVSPFRYDDEDRIISLQITIREITERKKAELKLKESEENLNRLNIILEQEVKDRTKELKESEEKFRNIAEQTLIGVAILQDDVLKYVNQQYSNIYRYSSEELKSWEPGEFMRLIHNDYKDIVREQARKKQLGLTNVNQRYIFRGIKKTGEAIWIENLSKTILYDGKPADLITILDITDRIKAEQKLRESELFFRSTLESTEDGILVVNDKGQVSHSNKKFAEMWHIPNEFIETMDDNKLLGYVLDQLKEPQAFLSKVQELYKSSKTDFDTLFFKDGRVFERYSSPLIRDNEVIGRVWSFNDITERKKAERKLKESEEKYRNLFANSPNAIALINLEGIIFDCNMANERIFGYKKEELIGKNLLETQLYPPETFLLLQERLEMMYTGGEVEPVEIEVFKKDGGLAWISPEVSIVKIGDESFIQFIGQDITEKKKREILIEKQNKKLKELNKLKTELMRRTSHELKTPLISIQGFADLLLDAHYDKLDKGIISIVEEIKQGCKRLKFLIDDILEASQLESEKIKLNTSLEDLSFLINFCAKELKILLKKRKQSLILNIHDKLETIFEKERIYEVLTNLLSNAMKYSPQKSDILVKSEIKDEFIIISIKDEGIGFTEEEKERIFTQFGKIEHYGQGLDIETEGTGLGLYITKRIIELHGGKVWLESEGKNKGSIFYFSLPIVKKLNNDSSDWQI